MTRTHREPYSPPASLAAQVAIGLSTIAPVGEAARAVPGHPQHACGTSMNSTSVVYVNPPANVRTTWQSPEVSAKRVHWVEEQPIPGTVVPGGEASSNMHGPVTTAVGGSVVAQESCNVALAPVVHVKQQSPGAPSSSS